MNLKWYLITRIWLLALLCLVLASAQVLWQTQRDQQRQLEATLAGIAKQVKNRLTASAMEFPPTGFDRQGRFFFWDPIHGSDIVAGVCVRYIDEEGQVRTSSCRGWPKNSRQNLWGDRVPAWFAGFYRLVLNPGQETVHPLSWNGRDYGRVVAALDPANQIAEVWHRINAMIGLTVVTVVVLCLLVYFVVSHALRPTREILSGLQRLERGDLATRLPRFRLRELHKMGEGFNRLAASLEHSIAQRSELTRKLVNIQEEERRYVARELHDEFGQCLAAINAVAASVTQTSRQENPGLAAEGEKLSRIAGHMMQALRDILNRLRPAGIDELGLLESLQGLVAEFGSRDTRIELAAGGDFGQLSQAIAVSVYRIVQECLTNVSKHSGATHVRVVVERIDAAGHGCSSIAVTVEDDGNAEEAALARSTGRGLLGMRERVTALGGQLVLRARESGGLSVHARIPVPAAS